MDKPYIERRARNLIGEILDQRSKFFPDGKDLDVVEVVDPVIAAAVAGLDYQVHQELRWFTQPLSPLEETAGILDREARTLMIADKFRYETRRFTAAHEIGHFVLHEGLKETMLHRDRPIGGLTRDGGNKPFYEREADHFAACLLMPRKSVIAFFRGRFPAKLPFVLDDSAAFELCPNDPDSLLRPYDGSLTRAPVLVGATHFRGKYFPSLSQRFQVSITSMAIRIDELGLIQE